LTQHQNITFFYLMHGFLIKNDDKVAKLHYFYYFTSYFQS